LERVVGATDLERRTHKIAITQGGKKFKREFMCESLKGVNQRVRQSVQGHEGAGDWGEGLVGNMGSMWV